MISGWIPLSLSGLICLIIALLLTGLALKHQDQVLQSLCFGFLTLLGLMIILVSLRSFALLWQLRSSRAELPMGLEAGREYCVPAPIPVWRWFIFIQLDCFWYRPEAEVRWLSRDGIDLEKINIARRGFYSEIIREFVVTDLLGLSRIRFRRTYKREFQVLPAAGQLEQQLMLLRWSSGEELSDPRGNPDGDRVDLRQYSRGDSPRTILWKVFARTRRLMVRVAERALAPRPRVCAYLLTGPQDEAAAAVCRILIEGERLGPDWRFGCDGVEGYDHFKSPAMQRLCRSADSRQPRPQQLSEYLKQAYQDGFSQGVVVLSLDLLGQEAALRKALAESPIPLLLCLAVDGSPATPAISGWLKWLLPPDTKEKLREQLRLAAQNWANFSGQIMVIDRYSGNVLGDVRIFARRSA